MKRLGRYDTIPIEPQQLGKIGVAKIVKVN
jgi:hypothetical protein